MAPDRPVEAGGLAYRQYGERGGETLVFWPGLQPAAAWRLDEPGRAWAAAGFCVLGASPPGWETPALEREEYRPTALAARIVCLLEELALDRVAYVGFSWGATIGCHLAVTAPERLSALVLLDAGFTDFQDTPGFEQPTFEQMLEQNRAFGFETWEAVMEAMQARTRVWRPGLEAANRSAFHEVDGKIVPKIVARVAPEAMAAAALGVMVEQPSLTLPELGRLELPVLLVASTGTVGTDWGRAALERFREHVPSADVLELDSGHDLLADAFEETISAVASWLRQKT